jgi:site-specific recombinase XerD
VVIVVVIQSGGQHQAQLAAGGLGAQSLVQPRPQKVQFSFLCGHRRYADQELRARCGLGRRCRDVGIIPAQRLLASGFFPGQGLILLSGRAGRPDEEFMMTKTKPSWAKVAGPLAEYADGFRAELFRLGYTPLTAACQLRLTAHLSRWLTAEGLAAQDLDMPTAERYFAARRLAGYANERTTEALGPLLGYLRRLGAAPLPPAEPATETSQLLDRFAAYLASERGLAPTTVTLNVRLTRPFLQQRALDHGGRLDLEQLTAGEVRAFVLDQARKQPRSAKRIVTALRSLLRFLHAGGVLAAPLAGAVPSPAGHALAGLPRALEPGQVEAMLDSCDPATATGRRDRAVLLMLSRMGLRAGEVAGLGLDDIGWRRGEITVRGKGGRRDRLPLPADVGAAIVAYLRDGRPSGALDRTVFIAAQAPRQALSYSGVTTIVAESAIRAGIPGPVHAHRLRHSAATAMLRGGGSLTEIGQALRHARPATTAIYAKVDIDALRPLGRPWPGQEETA